MKDAHNPVSTIPLLSDLSSQELLNLMAQINQPPYRAKQIWQGFYQNLWVEPADFTTLPQSLRATLDEKIKFRSLQPAGQLQSTDHQTTKIVFTLPDNTLIETVLMEYDRRRTLCISTQAGCAMGCVFCATGQMGFLRNLSSGEIIEQVLFFARHLKAKGEYISNIVVMGMGEPFHNYDATIEAIERLNDPEGFNLGARRFTISTVGLIPSIHRFTQENRQVNLAISLHAATDELRSQLLPINKKYPLSDLIAACKEYVEITKRRITFEWALIQDVNDSIEQATKLVSLIRGLLCHVNVIPLNPTQKYPGKPSVRDQALRFQTTLVNAGIPCTIRVRRGIDIQAGCGQLAGMKMEKHGK